MIDASDFLIHDRTKKHVELFIKSPSHALLLTGLTGSGKYFLARQIATSLLKLDDVAHLSSYPYYVHISKPVDKQEISIDLVRELIHKLQLKTPGTQGIRRIVIVENAHFLSIEAQNALLKTLEEPASDTVIILTATSNTSVLPTIASRAQQMYVHAISLNDAKRFYGKGYEESHIEGTWTLSGGTAGLMDALLTDAKTHPLKIAVDEVKDLIKQDPYQRVLTLDHISRDKIHLALVLEATSRVLASLQHVASRTDAQTKRLVSNRKIILKLLKMLDQNTNPRLVALDLALNLAI
jgi:DNA polymerase-3 subunit delta'